MAHQIKVGLNLGRKIAGLALTGRILSRLLAYDEQGSRFVTSILALSAASATVTSTLAVGPGSRSVFPEDALYKRMQLLR